MHARKHHVLGQLPVGAGEAEDDEAQLCKLIDELSYIGPREFESVDVSSGVHCPPEASLDGRCPH